MKEVACTLVRLNNQATQMACERNDETVANDKRNERTPVPSMGLKVRRTIDCVLSNRANFSEKAEDYLVMGVTME